jgi:CRISPR system Cascade subunit CasC
MLIEIHILQNHAPSNLNRDDTGSPKQCVFAGVPRARISSQCLKRSIRKSKVFADAIEGMPLAMRTRKLPDLVRARLVELGLSEELAAVASAKVTGFGTKEGKERADEGNTAQTMFLTDVDIDAVAQVLKEAAEEAGTAKKLEKVSAGDLQKHKSLKAWRPVTLDVALFGRMITSPAFENVDASMQVAHAISTHKIDHEFDYFTAVDDLQEASNDDDLGADMIGDVEFNSACYYKYFSVDADALCRTMAGLDADASRMAEARQASVTAICAFLEAAIFVSPTGKQNTFAAHQLPAAVLVEVRKTATPVSYANAFVSPARVNGRTDLVAASIDQFSHHVQTLTRKFMLEGAPRLWFTTGDCEIEGTLKCETVKNLFDGIDDALASEGT